MKSVRNIFIGAVGLLIGMSACSDDFLKEKKDYNRMTTVDVFSDKTRLLPYSLPYTNKYCQDIILLFVVPTL